MALLEIDHLTKHFPAPDGRAHVCVFRDVALAIAEGEFASESVSKDRLLEAA